MHGQAWLSGRREISLSGEIDFDTAPELDRLVKSLLAEAPGIDWQLNMDGVVRVNSAALALLLSWHRFLAPHQGALEIKAMPGELIDLARVCGVDEILQAH
ncbi:STAS domain-containing protein [Aestuariirhabdus sp. Z084]|uniref:STAS domain-containing protein n=1 Tax=Aestuariirhabdus haliotis TaxID=2918751 RepID=UPI00201B3647|nr:STAS domain-containing protein [Aestuariirhabdus haliotis]MCL6415238.1 STAS domain-containing protein [Aestuariirhabdus haliotis]MCL6419498.1 STAS domain-containing protein [Aestuariirhabdus haliotis]